MRKIEIEQGNEFKIYNHNLAPDEDIFGEQYLQAESIMKELIYYSERDEPEGNQQQLWEYLNNIIAFCGERGQGKSSAMIQFINKLKNEEYGNELEIMDTIDPTAMESLHDIIDIVISGMFSALRSDRERRCGGETDLNRYGGFAGSLEGSQEQQLRLMEYFQKVHKNLAVLKNSEHFIKDEYIYSGSIQNLADIADSMHIKQSVMELIKEYLRQRGKKLLVISIDDLDLNIRAAYKMMEQIRKYLMIPQVVIVMAVNARQLSICVEHQFLLDMEGLERSVRWQNGEEAKKMANKYMEKLIPLSRRLILPDIRTISSDGRDAVKVIYRSSRENAVIFDSKALGIEKGLLQLIYKRTGLLFVAGDNEVHPIIPGTLRELVSLFSVLGTMEAASCRKNLEQFEDYLFNIWADNNLKEEYGQWFVSLKTTSPQNIHNAVFLYLYKLLPEEYQESGKLLSRRTLLYFVRKAAADCRARKRKLTNGDILNCIRLLKRSEDGAVNQLIFAVTTYFSILMLKLCQDGAERRLLHFIGRNCYGAYQLIREEQGDRSRLHYNYKQTVYWRLKGKDIAKDDRKLTVSQIKKYYSGLEGGQKALAQTLAVMGCVSVFEWNDGIDRGLVSGNNNVADKAEFSINNLLIRQLSPEAVWNNISGESWGLKDPKELEESIGREWSFFAGCCRAVVCNMEAMNYIARYLTDRRDIRERLDNDISLYYRNFFQCFYDGFYRLDSYIGSGLLEGLEEEKTEIINKQARVLADFWNASSNAADREISDNGEDDERGDMDEAAAADPEANKKPSYVRSNFLHTTFRKRLDELIGYLEWMIQSEPASIWNQLKKEADQLNMEYGKYAGKYSDTEQIGQELAVKYNKIWRRL